MKIFSSFKTFPKILSIGKSNQICINRHINMTQVAKLNIRKLVNFPLPISTKVVS